MPMPVPEPNCPCCGATGAVGAALLLELLKLNPDCGA